MPTTDRDLIVLEPSLFRDHAWLGQRLVIGSASITGGVATFTLITPDLLAALVQRGHILMHDGVPFEIIEVYGADEALVAPIGPIMPANALAPKPPQRDEAPAFICTFSPQIQLAHHAALRLFGIEPGESVTPATPGTPGEQHIINESALTNLESLMALELIFAAAATPGPSSALLEKSEWYRKRAATERQHLHLHLDLNQDGRADAKRSSVSVPLVRG
jgi:hypothetical protein